MRCALLALIKNLILCICMYYIRSDLVLLYCNDVYRFNLSNKMPHELVTI